MNTLESISDLEKRKYFIKEKFLEYIGGLPHCDNSLNARVTGTVVCDGYKIEKVMFQSQPKIMIYISVLLI